MTPQNLSLAMWRRRVGRTAFMDGCTDPGIFTALASFFFCFLNKFCSIFFYFMADADLSWQEVQISNCYGTKCYV